MERKRIHKDNTGSAMVMVMVAIALIGILVSVLMFVAYSGYQMRLTDRHGKDNFYTAETVLDEINVGLQGEISKALGIAYEDLMKNYGLYETPEMRKTYLYNTYFARLQELLTPSGTTSDTVYDITKLRGYLTAEICGDGASADGSLDNFGTYGAIVESAATSGAYALVLSETGMVLKDLKVTYVDQTGFVSIITTDIKIVLPAVSFDQSLALPELEKFATIADEGLIVYNERPGGSVEIFGDVYAGKIDVGLESGAVPASLNFKKPAEESGFSRVVSRETITVGSQMRLDTEKIELWCKDIQLDGVSLTLDGITNVADDLTVGGSGSTLSISGEYYGYGVYTTEFDQQEKQTAGLDETLSSAIVVNGQSTEIDLSATETLFLGGHAYISTAFDGEETAENVESRNRNNVLMGESLAVKSNQLVYLIPPECLGCEIDETGVIGSSKYYRNPLTLEQYQDIFVDNRDRYEQVDVNRAVAGLGGKNLANYLIPEPVAGSDVLQYVPETVFKRTAGGTLVYCYMRFKDAEAANAYFRDYYGVNAEAVEKYTKLYANEIQVKSPDSMTSYYLAGNILTYGDSAEGTGSVIEATDSYGRRRQAESSANTKAEMFRALNVKLVTNPAQLRMVELDRNDVFDNIIDIDKMNEVIDAIGAANTAQISTFDGTLTAIFSRTDYVIDKNTPENISMVICDGDVTVSSDFNGLIIASGTITVWDDTDENATVVLRPITQENFTTLMGANRVEGDKTYIVLDVFRDGVNYAFTTGTLRDVGTREVNLADLIRYENWSKK